MPDADGKFKGAGWSRAREAAWTRIFVAPLAPDAPDGKQPARRLVIPAKRRPTTAERQDAIRKGAAIVRAGGPYARASADSKVTSRQMPEDPS